MLIDPYNGNANLTNRQIKINMRSMMDQMDQSYSSDSNDNSQLVDDEPMKNEYKPSITTFNLNKKLRNLGLPIPRSLCTELWCVMDCGGYFGVGFTWFFIFIGETLVFLTLSLRETTTATLIHAVFSAVFAFMGFVAHCRAMFTDPGAVPRGDATEENIYKLSQMEGHVFYRCVKCDSIKPDRAHHCSTCKRCIKKMDHHCPWINNCVGEGNQKYFILFTLYVCLISWHALAVAIYNLVTCAFHNLSVPNGSRHEFIPPGCTNGPAFVIVITICLMMEGLLFGLFTLIMFCTQFSSVCSNQTGIESLKKEKRQKQSCLKNLREVFGGPPSFRWLSPFHSYKNIQHPMDLDSFYEVM